MSAEDQNGQEQTTREIGAVLARTRREKGLSLRDVEQATKIRTRYLEGLEQDDFNSLPDPVYVRGFLKTYANFLGLDGDRLSRELKDRRGPRRERHLGSYEVPGTSEANQALIAPEGVDGAERRRLPVATLLTIALAALALAAVIGGLYFFGRSFQSEQQRPVAEDPAEQQPEESPSADQPGATGEPDEAAENTALQTVQATVRVVGASSVGITVRTDGTVAYSQVAQPGFSQEFQAQDLLVVEARNGNAVEVEVDGQDAERLGNSGQPATREFTPEESGG